ncbi:MAG: M1 family metallopeptidase [Tenacibaculum sp.]
MNIKLFVVLIASITALAWSKIKQVNFINQKETANLNNYWQQKVNYTMDIDVDVNTFKYKGIQKLVYTNNSPDVLHKVFYHLYFNAFKPNSQMDIRSRSILDPDKRVGDRISKLTPSEIGYIEVNSLKQSGEEVKHKTVGTLLEVSLNQPILPGESVTFDMIFNGQIPNQIRRSGRNNSEGVALSMTQWYPKMAEYDFEGWHTPPYIGREFYGVWGDFDVKIHIDKKYTVGATGYLQNPSEIGHGYNSANKPLKLPKGDKLTWHFKAPNVHDFTWAADPEYIHDILTMENGIVLHFLYKKNLEEKYLNNWKQLPAKTARLMKYFSQQIGKYPYKQYSVIQGGDGGMEYAMCTLITGKRNANSLLGVTAHELAHTWFQFLLATNESKYAWMDEGFTSYITSRAIDEVFGDGQGNPHKKSYDYYKFIVSKNIEEPLTTHADRFNTNAAYGMASYSKGSIFLSQLEYLIGKDNVDKSLKKYFDNFSFKHPTPNDFKRTAEKISGIHLGWYLNEWTQTTHTIDYGIKSLSATEIVVERIGEMPMPIDIEVTYSDGTKEMFYIPLQMMRGEKPTTATLLEDWTFAHPNYSFTTQKEIKLVEIDPSKLMADKNLDNNQKAVE